MFLHFMWLNMIYKSQILAFIIKKLDCNPGEELLNWGGGSGGERICNIYCMVIFSGRNAYIVKRILENGYGFSLDIYTLIKMESKYTHFRLDLIVVYWRKRRIFDKDTND